MVGIRVEKGGRFFGKGVIIAHSDIGIQSDGGYVDVEGATFTGVRQPFDISGGSEVRASGSRIMNDPKLAPSTRNRSQVGYVPVAGPAMPAMCPKCGSIFPSVNYKIRDSRFWSRDNEEVCPVCGNEHAKVADGLYEIASDAIGLVKALAQSPGKFPTLKQASEQILTGQISADAGWEVLSAAAPELQSLRQRANAHGFNAAWFVGILIAIAISYLFTQPSGEANSQNAHFDRAIEYSMSVMNDVQKLVNEDEKQDRLKRDSGVKADGEAKPKAERDNAVPHNTPKGPRIRARKSKQR